jgi:hypothetical protein
MLRLIKKFFRKIMNHKTMNYTLLIVTGITGVVCFAAGFLVSGVFRSPYNEIVSRELSRYGEGKWLVKIDGDKIGDAYLEKRYRLYKKYISREPVKNDLLMKDRLLRKLIDDYCVLQAVRKAGIAGTEKAGEYLWLFTEEALVNYYLDFMAELKSGKKIELSAAEMNDFYSKYKGMFDKKHIPKEKAFDIIKRELDVLNDKYKKQGKYIARRIELGRLKKGKKIVINKELMKTNLLDKKPK